MEQLVQQYMNLPARNLQQIMRGRDPNSAEYQAARQALLMKVQQRQAGGPGGMPQMRGQLDQRNTPDMGYVEAAQGSDPTYFTSGGGDAQPAPQGTPWWMPDMNRQVFDPRLGDLSYNERQANNQSIAQGGPGIPREKPTVFAGPRQAPQDLAVMPDGQRRPMPVPKPKRSPGGAELPPEATVDDMLSADTGIDPDKNAQAYVNAIESDSIPRDMDYREWSQLVRTLRKVSLHAKNKQQSQGAQADAMPQRTEESMQEVQQERDLLPMFDAEGYYLNKDQAVAFAPKKVIDSLNDEQKAELQRRRAKRKGLMANMAEDAGNIMDKIF